MAGPSWLEVSMIVDGELAEAVADLLARYIPNGVVVESTAIAPDPDGEGTPTGPLRVCGYLPVDDQVEETRRRLEEALWYLGRIRELPPAEFKPLEDANWMEAWKEHYHPIPTGQKLIILPAWLENPDPRRIPIRVDPGMAFGTGAHPTTQLCLEIIEKIAAETGLSTVIDVGCGSGILSIAAVKLGARRALGVDIDPQAIPNARKNAEANGVSGQIELGAGSVNEVRAGMFSLQQSPLVLANILAPVIIRLLDGGLANLLAPGGVLVLSGILEQQWDGQDGHVSVRDSLRNHNLEVLYLRQMGDWIAIAVK